MSVAELLPALVPRAELGEAAHALFAEGLDLPLSTPSFLPIGAKGLLGNAWHDDFDGRIENIYLLGVIDEKAFDGEVLASAKAALEQVKEEGWSGMLVFAIELAAREPMRPPTRTELSHIVRAFNRASQSHPAVILFHYPSADGPHLALAACERHAYQQEWREGERPGRIAMLRGIDPQSPHSGHLRILNQLVISRTGRGAVKSFEALHAQWRKVFDIDVLNKAFYNELSDWFFWACRETVFPGAPDRPDFPNDAAFDAAHQTHQATSVIRLITRMLFVWFLKEKKLIPAELFEADALAELVDLKADPSALYKAVLQNLFFATLNQELAERRFRSKSSNHYTVTTLCRYKAFFQNPDDFLELQKQIPFLNCGLFECQDKPDPVEKGPKGGPIVHRLDGFSDRKDNPLRVPNALLIGDGQEIDLNADYGRNSTRPSMVRGLFQILARYTFTITENTPLEQDVALDPELLGKVFENLLAAYNPETKETARKKTGSFYTPRHIVDYMVVESLIIYLMEQIPSLDGQQENLRVLLADEEQQPFATLEDRRKLIDALGEVKILDPACGSGAYPMGALQVMVKALRKLDPDNELWKQRQIDEAQQISDPAIRADLIDNIEAAFAANEPDYGRKLYLIENCIYGVDIQPIAAQISKLRFFISLMVDQVVDPDKENFGVRALPNLETKLVAANTLFKLDHEALTSDRVRKLEAELADIRHRHFAAKTARTKAKYREKDRLTREDLAQQLAGLGMPAGAADEMASWDPYDQNATAGFFDAEWMFNLPRGFDIVVGNPPYVRHEKITAIKPRLRADYSRFKSTADLYVYFYDRGFELLKNGGVLTYISSNKYFRSGYGDKLRGFLSGQTTIFEITDFGDAEVFEAIAYPSIIVAQNSSPSKGQALRALNWEEGMDVLQFSSIFAQQHFTMPQKELTENTWRLESEAVLRLLDKLKRAGTPLGEFVNGRFYRGIVTGRNEAFVVDQDTRDKLIAEDPGCEEIIKPFLRGRDMKRWQVHDFGLYLIFTRRGIDIDAYPSVKKYLQKFRAKLEPKPAGWDSENPNSKWPGRKAGSYKWYEIQDNIAYYEEFSASKIVYPDIYLSQSFALDESKGYFLGNTCYFIPDAELWLVALLNSSCIEWFYSHLSNRIRGGYLRAFSRYIQSIPVPASSSIQKAQLEELAEKCRAKRGVGEAEAKIDSIIFDLFACTPQEKDLILENGYDKYNP